MSSKDSINSSNIDLKYPVYKEVLHNYKSKAEHSQWSCTYIPRTGGKIYTVPLMTDDGSKIFVKAFLC